MPRTQLLPAHGRRSLSFRLVDDWPDLAAVSDLIHAVWGDGSRSLAPPALLRTLAYVGNPVIGAYEDGSLCGASVGFLAPADGTHLHSHITGVLAADQHRGVGFGLKSAQRAWCLAHRIDVVTWTFDPMIARNARFNMRKLGATSNELLPGFYGDMDDAFNAGDETDRLAVRWVVSSASTAAALDAVAAGRPRPAPANPIEKTIALPADYHALRATDPDRARTWRRTVREQLLDAFSAGLEIVDFDPADGYRLASRT